MRSVSYTIALVISDPYDIFYLLHLFEWIMDRTLHTQFATIFQLSKQQKIQIMHEARSQWEENEVQIQGKNQRKKTSLYTEN